MHDLRLGRMAVAKFKITPEIENHSMITLTSLCILQIIYDIHRITCVVIYKQVGDFPIHYSFKLRQLITASEKKWPIGLVDAGRDALDSLFSKQK